MPLVVVRTSPRPWRGVLILTLLLVSLLGGAATPVAAAHTKRHTTVTQLEHLALSLLNCTRTGGWVQANGRCADRGSGKHSRRLKPLKVSASIADRASRPYAKRMLAAGVCSHYVGYSSIQQHFRNNGFKGSPYGESIGCGYGLTPRQMLIYTELTYQSEQGTGGWHWRNLKDAGFDRVGVGVAVSRKGSRVVFDFYGG